MEISLFNDDRNDGSVLVTCRDKEAAIEDQAIDGDSWEVSSDLQYAYALLVDRPTLVDDLRKDGYKLNLAHYDPWEDDTRTCQVCGARLHYCNDSARCDNCQ